MSEARKQILDTGHGRHHDHKDSHLLEFWVKQCGVVIKTILVIFSLAFIVISLSLQSRKSSIICGTLMRHANNRPDVGNTSSRELTSYPYGYPPQMIENVVRDRHISIVLPVHAPDGGLLVNLLRSIKNLCSDCRQVPIIVITDDGSKNFIHDILHSNKTTPYPKEPPMAASFPQLSIKVLRDVMPYYAANSWNDGSLLVNGKYLIQSHKKMFGVLNGATTRFSLVMDVDSFVFKPMSLASLMKTYLSSPYIFTTHDWSPGRAIFECAESLTGSFLTNGYTLEIMHWIYDREIVSDFNKVVLSQFPTWNVPILFRAPYFFEVAYYHFLMSNQILQRKYMQYRIVEIRTLLGGNFSPLLQAIVKSASGGMIERISNALSSTPSIYSDVVRIWKQFQIPFFRPESSEIVSLDFALDTDVVLMTNSFKEGLYRMGQSGYWTNKEEALKGAEAQGWKELASHARKRDSKVTP